MNSTLFNLYTELNQYGLINIRSHNKISHTNHPKPVTDHIHTPYSQLNQEQKNDLKNIIQASANIPMIKTFFHSKHKLLLKDSTIDSARRELTFSMLKEINTNPQQSSCDRLISFFKNRDDVSFILVTHTINSGFVTMVKTSKMQNVTTSSEKENASGVDKEEIESWRNCLKIEDGKKILVALAWVHKIGRRQFAMFPEVLSVDVTFGVCKEQRNLLRIVGIDGDLKTFEVMNCFMPSKQYKAYEWAINVAFPKLCGSDNLLFNSFITTDQEDALVRSVCKLTHDKKCNHRLDMYHVFIKEWKNKVSFSIWTGPYTTTFNID